MEDAPQSGKPEQHRGGRAERLRAWRRAHPLGAAMVAMAIVAALILGAFIWRYLESYESTDDAQVDGHISPVSTRVEGTVLAVYVEDNQLVKSGDLLVALDPRDNEVALERAEAERAQAGAQVQVVHPNVPITETSNEVRISTQQQDVLDAEAGLSAATRNNQSALAQVLEAQANEERARSDANRYRYLVKENAVTAESYVDRMATAKATTATVSSRRATARATAEGIDQQRARLAEARSRLVEAVRNSPRQIQSQRASVLSTEHSALAAQASVDQARLNLSYTKIYAPVSGIVGHRTVEVGARVTPGQSLLAIVDLDHLWVTANFKETQLGRMQVGQKGRFHVDALDRDYDCEVQWMPGASGARFSLFPPENATGNYVKIVQRLPVRVQIDAAADDERRLRPGMSVEPKIFLR